MRRLKKQKERQNSTRDISIGPHLETDEEEDEKNEFLPKAVYPEMYNWDMWNHQKEIELKLINDYNMMLSIIITIRIKT